MRFGYGRKCEVRKGSKFVSFLDFRFSLLSAKSWNEPNNVQSRFRIYYLSKNKRLGSLKFGFAKFGQFEIGKFWVRPNTSCAPQFFFNMLMNQIFYLKYFKKETQPFFYHFKNSVDFLWTFGLTYYSISSAQCSKIEK